MHEEADDDGRTACFRMLSDAATAGPLELVPVCCEPFCGSGGPLVAFCLLLLATMAAALDATGRSERRLSRRFECRRALHAAWLHSVACVAAKTLILLSAISLR